MKPCELCGRDCVGLGFCYATQRWSHALCGRCAGALRFMLNSQIGYDDRQLYASDLCRVTEADRALVALATTP